MGNCESCKASPCLSGRKKVDQASTTPGAGGAPVFRFKPRQKFDEPASSAFPTSQTGTVGKQGPRDSAAEQIPGVEGDHDLHEDPAKNYAIRESAAEFAFFSPPIDNAYEARERNKPPAAAATRLNKRTNKDHKLPHERMSGGFAGQEFYLQHNDITSRQHHMMNNRISNQAAVHAVDAAFSSTRMRTQEQMVYGFDTQKEATNFRKRIVNPQRTDEDLTKCSQLVLNHICRYSLASSVDDKLQAIIDLMNLQTRSIDECVDLQLNFLNPLVYKDGSRPFLTIVADLIKWVDVSANFRNSENRITELRVLFIDVIQRIYHRSEKSTGFMAERCYDLLKTGWDLHTIRRVFAFLVEEAYNPEIIHRKPTSQEIMKWMVKILRVLPLECDHETEGHLVFEEEVVDRYKEIRDERPGQTPPEKNLLELGRQLKQLEKEEYYAQINNNQNLAAGLFADQYVDEPRKGGPAYLRGQMIKNSPEVEGRRKREKEAKERDLEHPAEETATDQQEEQKTTFTGRQTLTTPQQKHQGKPGMMLNKRDKNKGEEFLQRMTTDDRLRATAMDGAAGGGVLYSSPQAAPPRTSLMRNKNQIRISDFTGEEDYGARAKKYGYKNKGGGGGGPGPRGKNTRRQKSSYQHKMTAYQQTQSAVEAPKSFHFSAMMARTTSGNDGAQLHNSNSTAAPLSGLSGGPGGIMSEEDLDFALS
ncbi:unnamed protein product [Amoebophrya sp. A120]|nr:unnamed protein product [Amoebophrya sp. A120]|eukprot:GSA120T00007267001.1